MSKELALPARCNLCGQTFYGPRLTFVGRPHGRQPQFLNNWPNTFSRITKTWPKESRWELVSTRACSS